MVSVSADEKLEEAAAFAKEVKATFPVIHDVEAEIFDKFGIEGLPANVLVGRDGKVIQTLEGFDEKALMSTVAKAMGR